MSNSRISFPSSFDIKIMISPLDEGLSFLVGTPSPHIAFVVPISSADRLIQ